MSEAETVIRARGLRKAFRIYNNPFDAVIEAVRGRKRHVEKIALDSVDLALRRGEIVGVLGRNGAGKSTLLKIIAGTLERTSGELEVNGRITAILELGTGFHPEYTGRENIYMGGLCLGMTRAEINAKMEAIIDFSELRDAIDQPFKTYSTGMQARLTFSTAISVDPDILIVDEALSVGDARFQMKCFSWIQRLREKNSTILLVSHDSNTITTFCDRALILDQGRVAAEGEAKKISVLYHEMLFGPKTEKADKTETIARVRPRPVVPEAEEGPPPSSEGLSRYGSGEGELVTWGIFDANGRRASVIESGTPCRLSMTLVGHAKIGDLSAGFAIKDRKGTVVWGMTNLTHFGVTHRVSDGERLTFAVNATMWLAAGDYFVSLGAAHLDDGAKIDFIEDAIGFHVMGPGTIFTTSVVNLDASMTIINQKAVDHGDAKQGGVSSCEFSAV